MASVWKRGSFWYISYYDRKGKRLTVSSRLKRQEDAQVLADRIHTRELLARAAMDNLEISHWTAQLGPKATVALLQRGKSPEPAPIDQSPRPARPRTFSRGAVKQG